MKPAVLFPDPQPAVRDLLRSLLASLASEAAISGVTVSTRDITGSDNAWPLPYVQVRSDGQFRDSQLNGRATVRVLCYGADVGLGQRLAAVCEALLLSGSSAQVRSCNPVAGPLPTSDPDTGLPLSYFTITARLRPAQLN